ncbi:hypothetical protein OE88DRAFT_670840 [Heliocybe sulcata]|uniref:Ubiquitin 3 binding protein But2 C-terminal domain-containing protein n=1 Tax=Heliocybe sulcata TaxID=5364 RepID=A0A5C3NET2_9AGAM|nr:hypothetical protein OE88DRAFT_670840 [Heliocybe sulcata]
MPPPGEAVYVPLSTLDDETVQTSAKASRSSSAGRYESNEWRSIWLSIIVSVLALGSALLLNSAVADVGILLQRKQSLARLPKMNPYPNFDTVGDLKKSRKMPRLWFPGVILRVNEEEPDREHISGSQVVLNETNSMFYRWRVRHPPSDSTCYIRAVVPTKAELEISNKSYIASGDTGALEVWNVTYPGQLHGITWNTKPTRIGLLGRLNFTSERGPEGAELRSPTPSFTCQEQVTVEISCPTCHIEFLQEFSDPMLAFDLQQLG